MRSNAGNALTEYGLIGAATVALVLPALIFFGGAISGEFTRFQQSLAPQEVSIAATDKPSVPGDNAQSATAQSAVQGSIQYTSPTGTVIQVPNPLQDMGTHIATAGANGTTSVMANTIEILAKQLWDAGSITQEQYTNLMDLANQGHYMAEIQKAIEGAAATAKSVDDYWNLKVNFKGQQVSVNEIRTLIGYTTYDNDPNSVLDPLGNPNANPETKKFQQLYQQALKNGALSDPQAQLLVANLASQIAYLGEVTNCAASRILFSNMPPANMNNQMVSDITHSKSANICTVKDGQDTGFQCSG